MTREEAIREIKNMDKFNYTLAPTEVFDMAIKAMETVEEFEKAQIITGGRLNGRTYAYKCGLEDGKRKALEQQKPMLDKIRAEIEQKRIGYPPNAEYYWAIKECLQIIDKYKAESEEEK